MEAPKCKACNGTGEPCDRRWAVDHGVFRLVRDLAREPDRHRFFWWSGRALSEVAPKELEDKLWDACEAIQHPAVSYY